MVGSAQREGGAIREVDQHVGGHEDRERECFVLWLVCGLADVQERSWKIHDGIEEQNKSTRGFLEEHGNG